MSLQPAESRLVVPFAGTVSGRAPLTWGEKALLQDQRETGWALNAAGAQTLAKGATVEEAAARLGRLVSNQPALRVRLGTEADGSLYQQVHETGELAVEVLDFADSDDPAEVAAYTERLWQEWLIAADRPLHATGPPGWASSGTAGWPSTRSCRSTTWSSTAPR